MSIQVPSTRKVKYTVKLGDTYYPTVSIRHLTDTLHEFKIHDAKASTLFELVKKLKNKEVEAVEYKGAMIFLAKPIEFPKSIFHQGRRYLSTTS